MPSSYSQSLKDAFAFYAACVHGVIRLETSSRSHSHHSPPNSYHSNKINQLIHIVCVPAILTTAFVFLHQAPLPVALPPIANAVLSALSLPAPSAALPAALGYAGYYLYLSPSLLGVSAAALTIGALGGAGAWTTALGARAVPIALGVHIVSWVAQFCACPGGGWRGLGCRLRCHLPCSPPPLPRAFADGHGVHEKRAPALLDNLGQALFMAPFFVLIEVLMSVGLLKDLAADVQPVVDAQIAAFKKGKGA